MKTVSLRFWIPFLFFFSKINALSQGSLSMVCAYPGSLLPVSITKWNIKYICGLQRTSFCLNHFPWNLKKSYVCIYQCDSPYPHQAVNDIDLMALLQGPLWNDKAHYVKLNLVGAWTSLRHSPTKVAGGLGTEQTTNMLCWLEGSYRKDPITVFSAAPGPQPSNRKVKGNFDKLKYHYH